MPKKGYKQTDEHKSKLRIAHIGLKHSEETKSKIRIANRDRSLTETTKTRMSISHAGHHPTVESREKMSISQTIRFIEHPVANTLRQHMSEVQKELWKDPEYAKKCLSRRTPSRPEQMFMNLSLPFQFVGNGELIIDGKNPDFVSIKDDHKLVEIWGEFFKKGRDPQDLIDFYKDRGYKCIVIWASELKHSDMVRAIVTKFEEA